MIWHDITLQIGPGMTVWKGDPPPEVYPISRIADGAQSNVTGLNLTTHTGTHIDAPWHFIDGGDKLDSIPFEKLMGKAYVLDLSGEHGNIEAQHLEGFIPEGTKRLLIKTANSEFLGDGRFHEDYVGLTDSGAHALKNAGVELVGVDYLSAAEFYHDLESVHVELLSDPAIVILEGLDLSQVEEGEYTLVCLPLKLGQLDGSPVRALLGEEE